MYNFCRNPPHRIKIKVSNPITLTGSYSSSRDGRKFTRVKIIQVQTKGQKDNKPKEQAKNVKLKSMFENNENYTNVATLDIDAIENHSNMKPVSVLRENNEPNSNEGLYSLQSLMYR